MIASTISWQPAHLQNNTVKLLPLSAGDFKTIYAIACDPLIWEQRPSHDRHKKDVFQVYFDEAFACGTAFLIADNATGKVIGCTR